MHPPPADLHAFRALMARGMFNRRDRRKMRAGSVGHHFTLFSKTHGQTEQTWSLLRRRKRHAGLSQNARRRRRTRPAGLFPAGMAAVSMSNAANRPNRFPFAQNAFLPFQSPPAANRFAASHR